MVKSLFLNQGFFPNRDYKLFVFLIFIPPRTADSLFINDKILYLSQSHRITYHFTADRRLKNPDLLFPLGNERKPLSSLLIRAAIPEGPLLNKKWA